MIHLDLCSSTQDEIKTRLAAMVPSDDPLWLRSDRQTAGRGRQGRAWSSEETRNLYLSCGFAWPLEERLKPLVSLLAGAAAMRVLGDLLAETSPASDSAPSAQHRLFLKWPNDLYVQSRGSAGTRLRKLGGLLAEAQRATVVVGWGVNLYPPRTPAGTFAVPPASLSEIGGRDYAAREVAERFAREFDRRWAEWRRAPMDYPPCFIAECSAAMEPLWGLRGRLGGTGGDEEAVAVALDPHSGELIVRGADGRHRAVSAGEFAFSGLSTV